MKNLRNQKILTGVRAFILNNSIKVESDGFYITSKSRSGRKNITSVVKKMEKYVFAFSSSYNCKIDVSPIVKYNYVDVYNDTLKVSIIFTLGLMDVFKRQNINYSISDVIEMECFYLMNYREKFNKSDILLEFNNLIENSRKSDYMTLYVNENNECCSRKVVMIENERCNKLLNILNSINSSSVLKSLDDFNSLNNSKVLFKTKNFKEFFDFRESIESNDLLQSCLAKVFELCCDYNNPRENIINIISEDAKSEVLKKVYRYIDSNNKELGIKEII